MTFFYPEMIPLDSLDEARSFLSDDYANMSIANGFPNFLIMEPGLLGRTCSLLEYSSDSGLVSSYDFGLTGSWIPAIDSGSFQKFFFSPIRLSGSFPL